MSVGPLPRSPAASIAVVVFLAIALALAGLVAVVIVFYPRCAGCPGQTPLGTALAIGNGTGVCIAGNGSSLADCTYTFSVDVYPSGSPPATIPSASDLTFFLVNPTRGPFNSTFIVTLTDQAGGTIGTWNSSSSGWAISAQGGPCQPSACLSMPLATGDSLILRSVPTGGLPYSHQGDLLRAQATGAGFSGFVDASIE